MSTHPKLCTKKDAVTCNGIINIQLQLLSVNHVDGTLMIYC